MNNIYKVIWSKAKNCYVVASEIARSHTKSATGSGKIGGVTRRSLLASLMALSLLCGGLGVASAADVVHVDESATGAAEVYTKTGVDTLLNDYGKKTDVDNNKNNIGTLQTTTTDQGQKIAINTTNIANNTTAIAKKIDTVTADATYATKDALRNLKDTVDDKADKTAVTTVLDTKADKTYVDTEVGKKADKATTLDGYGITDAYTRTDADGKFATSAALNTAKTDLEGKITANTTKIDANKTDIDDLKTKAANTGTTLNDLSDRMVVAENNITNLKDKDVELSGNIGANKTAIDQNKADITQNKNDITTINGKLTTAEGNIATNQNAIAELKTKVGTVNNGTYLDSSKTVGENLNKLNDGLVQEVADRKVADTALSGRITANANTIAEVNQQLVNTNNHFNTELRNTNAALQAEGKARAEADAKINTKIGNIDDTRTAYVKDANSISQNLTTLDEKLQATNDRTGGIARNAEGTQTTIEGSVKVDKQGNVKDVKGLSAETITTTGNATIGDALNVTGESNLKNTTVDGTLSVNKETTLNDKLTAKGDAILGTDATNTVTVNGTADFNEAVNMDKGLTVTNGATNLQETTVNGKLTAKENATFEKNVTVQNDLTVNGKLNVGKISMKNDELDINGDQHDSTTTITADGISNNAKVTDRNGVTTESKFTHDKEGSTTYAKKGDATDWKEATSNVTADGVENIAKDSKDNNNTFTQTSTDTKNTLTDKEGNTSTTRQDSKGIYGYAKDKDGNKSYTKQEGNRIAESVIGQDGKETKSEMTSTDITNTAKDGTIISDAKDIVNKATGNISNSSATMDTTVTGKATESYGELETEVKGNEKHTVKGDQTNEVDGKQINTIKNGQENIISGGQTNTITGDQTTTITGNKTETVTENVTEDYKKDLTTTVGGNETHEVKGTKTETVEGKVTENFKNGQETNVTGDQVIKVSGTQTTTATDINRNASSGMIDTIDNDYGTNTETKVAGKTTTDVSIKGTGEEGKYIRGANESRDYLIKGTLKNTETKTVEKTSTEITDGNGKTSATIQDVNNLAGSVTNGTETGVSGIHANDNSVSIDSIVTDGNKYSVINQKKGSIQSTVVDGTNSTVILQDKDNVTIASSNGTVAIGGKDIVNKAQDTITNTAGTSITNQVKDSKVTTDVDGTTFENKTAAVSDGGTTTTKINGNHINTGRVDANELGVSDKDGVNTPDLSVKAGEGVKASAGNGTTTGSLDVTAKEVGSSVKDDASGKGSTFKQRIDAIMGNVKTDAGESEVTQKGDEITSVVGKGEATNSRVTQKKGSLEAGVTDGTNTNASYDVADASAKVLTGGTKVNKLQDNLDSSEKTITNGTYTTSKLQTALDITNTAKDGTITNDAKNIVNNASGNMTNTVGGDLKTTVAGNELHEVTGTKTENVTGKVTENYGNGQETNVTGDQYIHVTGKQTNKIDGDQENIIGGNQTTTVIGDISNKAENITNEANTKLTDKVGDHTRVLDSEGITDTVGGSTFKQRIDKIMMESKDVSIKAEETLANEAKVITNKASEVINNEAVNINNTATGIITSKASEIKNQADKLISNKVGENTWENMENGKITTSIKDGAKQNLTQSDAAGTTQSTVDGGKSTVTIQNADGLVDAVTDGTNTSVQNQTASAIAAAVKDGAGNENASAANATTSVNTIKSGSKANTVISTADGTSFINSEAAAPVGDGTEVKTTIKGNTITTGKVTMDYAEVMKDLGVRGNANITGKTTTGSLEVTGTSTLKGDVTMESNATVKKDLTVEGNTNLKNTKVDGTLDVTQRATFHDAVDIKKNLSVDGNATIKGDVTASSYKVGDKTYISAAGINANNQKITNVADGSISEGSKDAVNGGQLYNVKNDLEGKVNKVGANAAAMANLHPMEFDPSSKWNIAAAIGNYGSETAAALGAFYRPNDDVMVNLSTAFGTGENMVGGGVSVRLGKGGNKLSREENNALKDQVNDLTARMDALLSVLNPNMSKDFPDVPENHWAYEAVSRLAGNDIVQGYPDGEFHGERTMTRYEMAEIIYNALSRGAEAEKELVEEFKPELQAMAASEKATAERAEG